jgi:hypothetical protein
MASSESEISRHLFSVSYDGPTRRENHSIDVQVLAPALLAFGKLFREANTEFNNKKSAANVLVVSDFENKCFNINLELIVSLYEQIRTFIGTDEVKSAKEILEWIGMVGGPPTLSVLSYLQYLKWRRGRQIESVSPLIDADESGIVEVRVTGDANKVQIHNHVHNLSENPKALRATRDAFLPLGSNGFESVEFKEGDLVTEEIGVEEVRDIVASCNVGIEESKETEPEIETSPAWLSVYSPVYDTTAPNWRFKLGTDIIYADISETDIAQKAIESGGTLVDDAYRVQLEITTEIDSEGKKAPPKYKILEVIRFVPSPPQARQSSFLDEDPTAS